MADTATPAPAPVIVPPVVPVAPVAPVAPEPDPEINHAITTPEKGYHVLSPIDYLVDGVEHRAEIGEWVKDLPEAAVHALMLVRAIEHEVIVEVEAVEAAVASPFTLPPVTTETTTTTTTIGPVA